MQDETRSGPAPQTEAESMREFDQRGNVPIVDFGIEQGIDEFQHEKKFVELNVIER